MLLVAPSLTAFGGGIELYCRQVLHALAIGRPDLPLAALLAQEPSLAKPELLPPGLVVSGGASRAGFLVAAARAMTSSPGVIICGHLHYLPLCAALAKSTGSKLVSLLYGVEVWPHGGRNRRLARWAQGRADLTVAISGFTAAQALRFLPVSASQVMVAPNAVDTVRFAPGTPAASFEARLPARPRLVTVARLDAGEGYKGVDQVIRALSRLPAATRPHYVVAGDGDDLSRLRALAAALEVPATFLGRISDDNLVNLYRAADLFIMASRNEGFGFVFIEAMACGVPVIGGGVDGSVEALDGGRLGLLIDPLDIDAIARAIADSLAGRTTPSLRDGKWLVEEVAARFGMPAFVARWTAVLDRVSPRQSDGNGRG